jgi:hypothetical protein
MILQHEVGGRIRTEGQTVVVSPRVDGEIVGEAPAPRPGTA